MFSIRCCFEALDPFSAQGKYGVLAHLIQQVSTSELQPQADSFQSSRFPEKESPSDHDFPRELEIGFALF
jgi:hypothetical protein